MQVGQTIYRDYDKLKRIEAILGEDGANAED